MAGLTVCHLDGDRFAIQVRHHTLTVDQPIDDGGEDTAPTPTELFVASLGSCVAFYVRRYLARHGLPTVGLAVTVDYTMTSRPARVGRIDVGVRLPERLPADRRGPLLAIATHCTVHNTLENPPPVTVAFIDSGTPVVRQKAAP